MPHSNTLPSYLLPLACAISLIAGCGLDEDEFDLDEDWSESEFRNLNASPGGYKSGRDRNTDDLSSLDDKATEWGYGVPGDPTHSAAKRMIAADFCGMETSHTQTGTPIGHLYINPDTDRQQLRKVFRGDEMEAAWNEHGAVCVNHSRLGGDIPCDLPQCPPVIDDSYALVWSQSWKSKDCGVLGVGEKLLPGQIIASCNGSVQLHYQPNGNLVIYSYSHSNEWVALWESDTPDAGPGFVHMRPDGNLVLYDDQGEERWASNTFVSGAVLRLQDDGNMCTFEQTETQGRWCTNTYWCRVDGEVLRSGDLDGDGADDLICQLTNGMFAIDYAADGLNGTDTSSYDPWCIGEGKALTFADVDGDGLDDMFCHDNGEVLVNYNSNGFGATDWSLSGARCLEGELLLGDVNGDGKEDMVCHGAEKTWVDLAWLGLGSASTSGPFDDTHEESSAWCTGANEVFRLADLDWDGKEDFLCIDRASGNIKHDYSENGFGGTDAEGNNLEPGVKFAWSEVGPMTDMTCTLINEPNDPHGWSDNYFCSSRDVGMQWSYDGPIADMDCTLIVEPSDPHAWHDNYLCLPKNSRIKFTWSEKDIRGPGDIKWSEGEEPWLHAWHDNYLTVSYH